MNIYIRLLKAFIRVLSLPYFIGAVFPLISAPERILMALNSQPALRSSAYFGVASLGASFLLQLSAAVCLWCFAGAIARKIGRDLDETV